MAINSTPPAPSGSLWYYALAGKRLGPVDEGSMTQLILEGTVTAQTMVWHQGMADWAPAGQTELASLLVSERASPPPLAGEHVDNTIVWTIAFVPLLSPFVTVILGQALSMSVSALWFVPLAMNTALCIADERRLKNAGHNTRNMLAWAILLVPVYLFVRASRLKQSYAYAVVWLVTFAISLFL